MDRGRLLSPRDLAPESDGLMRLDRQNIHAQILLNLSQDETEPTRLGHLVASLRQFSYPQVVDALRRLTLRGYVANVGHGRYVTRWARIPGVES